MNNKHMGSSFDDFLEKEGLLAQAQAITVARMLAWDVNQYLTDPNATKTALAKGLGKKDA